MLNPNFILFLLVAVLPAYYTNRYLMKLVQPRRSFLRFILFLVIILGAAFLYTFAICWVLVKFIWPVR